MNSHRGSMVVTLVFLAGIAAVRAAPMADDGPASIDCGKDRSPLAVTVCNDRAAAAAERRTTTSYFALYFQLPEGSRSAFRTDHLQWLQGVTARCRPQQSTADQLALPAQCVRQLYSQRADLYRKKLSGAALEEAGLSPALLKKLQKRLVDLKFLSGTPDGMFGADTRAAIKNYQASIGHPQDNFLSAQERTTLLDTTTVASASTAAPQQPAVSPWEATSPPAGVLQPSIQDPQNADKPQQPGPNVADRTLAQTDQPNAPDAPSPSAQADATGAPVDAGSGFQEQYFIAGALLAVAILGFAAILVFMILRRPKKRTTGFDDVVGIDPSVGVSMKEDPLRIIPYTQTDAPLVVDLRLKEEATHYPPP